MSHRLALWLLPASVLVCLGCAPEEAPVHFTRILDDPAVSDTFSSPSASWVDIDGDGDEDLYVLHGFASLDEDPAPQPSTLFLNDGAGSFHRAPSHPLVRDTAFSGSATWGDYDNDGDLDVFVANQTGADNFLFRREGASFVPVTEGAVVSDGGRSFSAVWVDVDGDGWLDLHVLNGRDGAEGEPDFLYRNLGDGTFERVDDGPLVTEALPSGGATWADFDGDGDADVFLPVQSTAETSRLYRNAGDWAFSEVGDEVGLTTDPLPYSPGTSVAHWIDHDGDLDLDLFVGTAPGTIDFLYENRGAEGFRPATAGRVGLDITYVSDAVWGDLDNDGDQDLVVAAWGGASSVYLNDGAGGLWPADVGELGDVMAFCSSVSLADIDRDGDLDVFLTQWPVNEAGGAPDLLYRNDTTGGHWVRIYLEGTTSNRSAIGARLVVTAVIDRAERRQLRHVTSRGSWRSTGSLTQHIGLGDAERIDAIDIAWPSGRQEHVAGPIGVDRTLRIVEGRGVTAGRS